MSIRADSVLLEPGSEVRLYTLDATGIDPAAGVLNFHGHRGDGVIVWKGVSYDPWSVEASGFERSGDRPATPSIAVGNVGGSITSLCLLYDDLIGAVLTERGTLVKYLDEVNFPEGNPTADPDEEFPDEIWFIDQKEHEDPTMVKWKLASALDFNGASLPGRIIVANQCWWRYRSAECGYAGPPVAKYDDTPTDNIHEDNCSRRESGCKLRFGADEPLPYGSFPAAGLIRT